MKLPPEEPALGPWEVVPLETFMTALRRELPTHSGRPSVVAIDGRSGNGKSTLAGILQQMILGSAMLHTDDIPSMFDWTEMLLENILEPARAGRAVRYRPQAWDDWGRKRGSAIEVPRDCPMLILEGVGAARRELMHLLDAVIWVQADVERAQARGIARDGGDAGARALWDTWNAQEFPFLAEQRPWERANLVVSGTPDIEYDAAREIVVAARSLY